MINIIEKSWLARKLYYGNRLILNRNTSIAHELTMRCNLDCKHCYQKDYKHHKLKEATLEDIRDFYKRMPNVPVKLTGGEPFCREDIAEIIKAIGKRELSILTNGTLLDSSKLKNSKISTLSVSIDG